MFQMVEAKKSTLSALPGWGISLGRGGLGGCLTLPNGGADHDII